MSTPPLPPAPEVPAEPPIRVISFAPSSQIAAIQYDTVNMRLIVEFQRGGVYEYYQVTEDVANGFEQAPSAGRYLATYVKGIYDYAKVG